MASNSTAAPGDLSTLTGPLLLGYMFNWGLYGILTVQVYIYHLAFKDDGRYTRGLVYTLFVLETAQTIIATNDAFNTYARNFGDKDILVRIQLIWLSIPVLTGIISIMVQMYYAYRIYVLSGSKYLPFAIIAVSLFQGIAAIIAGAQAEEAAVFTLLEQKAHTATTIWHVGSAVCDVLITSIMTFFLVRRDTGMDATHELIYRLVRLIVETGLINATMAVIDIILFLSTPTKLYFMCAALVLTKMYSNSLLVLFNSRVKLASRKTQTPSTSHTSYIAYAGNSSLRTTSKGGVSLEDGRRTAVRIHEETVTWSDSEALSLERIPSTNKSRSITDAEILNEV